jgi:Zn-dependent peptidase ImmA (M78 family)
MKYVPDKTGRFIRRPHYEPGELDDECEQVIVEFLKKKYGKVSFPILTNDLTLLIEQDAEELDLLADLSKEGSDVQGVTYFYPKKKPRVRIARELSEGDNRENRLRTTLTHEYGHVKFHNYVWQLDLIPTELPTHNPSEVSPKCNRGSIINAAAKDWMEWQAGYISGALLMPIGALTNIVGQFSLQKNLFAPIVCQSVHGMELQNIISEQFQVSQDAARVRLLQLKVLSMRDNGPSLF